MQACGSRDSKDRVIDSLMVGGGKGLLYKEVLEMVLEDGKDLDKF